MDGTRHAPFWQTKADKDGFSYGLNLTHAALHRLVVIHLSQAEILSSLEAAFLG